MKKLLIIFLLLPVVINAQTTVFPGQNLAWDQAAVTLADAQGYSYIYYPDGATNGTLLSAVKCSGTTSPFKCIVPFPAFTPGAHSLTLTSRATLNGFTTESAKSLPLMFTFTVLATPTNLRIE
jgi:hypothetical protein